MARIRAIAQNGEFPGAFVLQIGVRKPFLACQRVGVLKIVAIRGGARILPLIAQAFRRVALALSRFFDTQLRLRYSRLFSGVVFTQRFDFGLFGFPSLYRLPALFIRFLGVPFGLQAFSFLLLSLLLSRLVLGRHTILFLRRSGQFHRRRFPLFLHIGIEGQSATE